MKAKETVLNTKKILSEIDEKQREILSKYDLKILAITEQDDEYFDKYYVIQFLKFPGFVAEYGTTIGECAERATILIKEMEREYSE